MATHPQYASQERCGLSSLMNCSKRFAADRPAETPDTRSGEVSAACASSSGTQYGVNLGGDVIGDIGPGVADGGEQLAHCVDLPLGGIAFALGVGDQVGHLVHHRL